MTQHKGELKLCAEGRRLFDEYCKQMELLWENKKMLTVFEKEKAWKEYQDHRQECEDCRYE